MFEKTQEEINKVQDLLIINKHEISSLKKITKTINVSDYEVLTDEGFKEIVALHETIPYEVYCIKLADGKELKCADNHIVFEIDLNNNLKEVFVKELTIGRFIAVSDKGGKLIKNEILEINNLGYEEIMYDLQLSEDSKRRYYTNGILSHNTETAKVLSEYLFGTKDSMFKLDMSEYMEKHSISRIIGAPAGYVGYEEGGMLADMVKNNPYCVVLFDEIEKAHPDVLNVLLQILDEGKMTDGLGREINFKNTIIIMTSNAGTLESNLKGKVGFKDSNQVNVSNNYAEEQIIRNSLTKYFKVEFLNRIDEQIVFRKLTKENVKDIVRIKLEELNKFVEAKKIKLFFDESVINFVSEVSYDEKFGGRPILRSISKEIQTPLAQKVLSKEIVDESEVYITYNEEVKELKFQIKKEILENNTENLEEKEVVKKRKTKVNKK